MIKNDEKHSHYGHRRRKKEQFLISGIDGFPEHEKLEFLLYYAIPRGDTNELAHKLINRFGNFAGVITAKHEELLEVEGVGEHTASMICLFRMIARYFIMEVKGNLLELNDTVALNNYCLAMFLDAHNEQVHVVYLDSELYLMGSEMICEGSLSKVDIMLGEMCRKILNSGSKRIVITHNHPNGSCMPSRPDVDVTRGLHSFLKKLDIELIDHVITGRDGVWSMRERENLSEIW